MGEIRGRGGEPDDLRTEGAANGFLCEGCGYKVLKAPGLCYGCQAKDERALESANRRGARHRWAQRDAAAGDGLTQLMRAVFGALALLIATVCICGGCADAFAAGKIARMAAPAGQHGMAWAVLPLFAGLLAGFGVVQFGQILNVGTDANEDARLWASMTPHARGSLLSRKAAIERWFMPVALAVAVSSLVVNEIAMAHALLAEMWQLRWEPYAGLLLTGALAWRISREFRRLRAVATARQNELPSAAWVSKNRWILRASGVGRRTRVFSAVAVLGGSLGAVGYAVHLWLAGHLGLGAFYLVGGAALASIYVGDRRQDPRVLRGAPRAPELNLRREISGRTIVLTGVVRLYVSLADPASPRAGEVAARYGDLDEILLQRERFSATLRREAGGATSLAFRVAFTPHQELPYQASTLGWYLTIWPALNAQQKITFTLPREVLQPEEYLVAD